MADATRDTGLLPRTYFRAPRVPFDFRAVALAVLGYGVFLLGEWLLNKITSGDHVDGIRPVDAFFGWVAGFVPIHEFSSWWGLNVGAWTVAASKANAVQVGLGGLWVFLVWAYFGQAIHRITSMRIARDEGLSLKEALTFSSSNLMTIVLCPVIVGAFIGVLWGCDALAGAVISIPWAGQLLSILLVPLAVISSLLILLIAIGGIFGMPLISAAAAWERNGSLDAISRAFSYVFARPLQFLWNYALIVLFVGVILLVGGKFEGILVKSVDSGTWQTKPSMFVNTPTPFDAKGRETYDKYSTEEKDLFEEVAKVTDERPFAKSIEAVGKAPMSDKLTVLVFFLILNLVRLGVVGYAIYWFLGATTSTYADLRADVDGTEEDEIYIEEEDEDLDALNRSDVPPAAAGGAPSAPPPAPPSSPPPGSTTG